MPMPSSASRTAQSRGRACTRIPFRYQHTFHYICSRFYLHNYTGNLCSDLCLADELVRLRVDKIVSVSDTVSRDTACENVADIQSALNALFVNVCNSCTDIPIQQLIEVARHIMENNSAEVVSALSATPLSTAALKFLKRLVHAAKTSLGFE